MYHVVLDPIVLLRGLINPHSICGSLLSEYAGRYKAIFSSETSLALVVLPRHPLLVAKYPRLVRVDPRQAGRLLAHAEKVPIDLATVPNAVVATAIAANADYIICEDAHLLAAREKIVTPMLTASEFVTLLASEQPVTPK